MRKTIFLGTAMALMIAPAASAQQQPAQPPAASQPAPADPSQQPAIQTISVVDIKELPETTQKAVNDAVAKTPEAELKQLRATIESNPQIKSALEAEGVTSEQVVIASMGNNGALTLVTKKPG